MTHLNKKEVIAIFAGLAVIAYLFFSEPLMQFFSSSSVSLNQNQMLNQNGFIAQDITVGAGALVQTGDLVAAHYVGKLTSGQVFDSSLDRGVPIQFKLGAGQVIRGWDEGVVGMRVGGKRILTVSPEFAYGAQTNGAIPANSTLVFEVELVSV